MTPKDILKLERNKSLLEAIKSEIPFVGMGATLQSGSDCYPYTVVEVSPTLDWVKVTSDTFTPGDKFDFYSNQNYIYTSDMDVSHGLLLKLHTCGKLKGTYSNRFHLGHKSYYQDPSF